MRAALVSDALDSLGSRAHCLGAGIAGVNTQRNSPVLVGRAFTARVVPMEHVPDVPYRTLLAALDEVGPGDVFVVATDRAKKSAFWGELLSTACRARGAAGAVTDGPVRDVPLLQDLGGSFPVFARGTVPYDIHPRFEIAEFGKPIEIDGVSIEPGALVVADADGVAIVPAALVEDVMVLVAEKNAGENLFRAAVADGMLPSVAYEKYRVL